MRSAPSFTKETVSAYGHEAYGDAFVGDIDTARKVLTSVSTKAIVSQIVNKSLSALQPSEKRIVSTRDIEEVQGADTTYQSRNRMMKLLREAHQERDTATKVFHGTIQAEDSTSIQRSKNGPFVGEYVKAIFVRNKNYNPTRNGDCYRVPKKLTEAWQRYMTAFNQAAECSARYIKCLSSEEGISPRIEKNDEKRKERALRLIAALEKSLYSKNARNFLTKWEETHPAITAHMRKSMRIMREYVSVMKRGVNHSREHYLTGWLQSCEHNRKLEDEGVVDHYSREWEKRFMKTPEDQERQTLGVNGRYITGWKRLFDRYISLCKKDLFLNRGYRSNNTWTRYKTAESKCSTERFWKDALGGTKKAAEYFRKVCHVDRMDGAGNHRSFQEFHDPKDIGNRVDALKTEYPDSDIFVSEATFHRNKQGMSSRTIDSISHIHNFHLDLDLKETMFWRDGMTDDEVDRVAGTVLNLIKRVCRANVIPEPSSITWSGGGFHLRWNLDKPMYFPPMSKPKNLAIVDEHGKKLKVSPMIAYERTQNALFRMFRHLGADEKAIDAARVLRPSGTTNMKYGNTVSHVGGSGDCQSCFALYRTEDFINAVVRKQELGEENAYTMLLASAVREDIVAAEKRILKQEQEKAEQQKKDNKKKTAKKRSQKAAEGGESVSGNEDTDKASEMHTRACTAVRRTLSKKASEIVLANLDEDEKKACALRFIQYRTNFKGLPELRSNAAFDDFTDYHERFADLMRVLRYAAQRDNNNVNGETVIGEGNRNYYALWAFQLYVNAQRDNPKWVGDVEGFMEHCYTYVKNALANNGLGKEWLEEHFDSTLNIGSCGANNGEEAPRGIWNNVEWQLETFWKSGHIRNWNHRKLTDYRPCSRSRTKDETDRLIESPGVYLMELSEEEDGNEEGALGRFPMLGYSVRVETIMKECGVTDRMSLEAGCNTLYSDETRENNRQAWRETDACKLIQKRTANSRKRKRVSAKALVRATTARAISSTRLRLLRALADKLGYTVGAVSNAMRRYVKTGKLPAAYMPHRHRVGAILDAKRDAEAVLKGVETVTYNGIEKVVSPYCKEDVFYEEWEITTMAKSFIASLLKDIGAARMRLRSDHWGTLA